MLDSAGLELMTITVNPPPFNPRSAIGRLKGLVSRLVERRRFYTVLILPHSRPQFSKLLLSRGFVLTMSGVAGLVLVAGLSAPHLWMQIETQAMRIERLERDRERLLDEKQAFEAQLFDLTSRLETFEARAGRLAGELEIDDLPSTRVAAGGVLQGEDVGVRRVWFEGELRSLQNRADTIDESLRLLDDAFARRVQRLASTPNVPPVEGWLSHGYGWRKDPFTGGREFHRGVDIVAPMGTEIRAPADGVVTRAARFSDYGKSVDISHGSGLSSRYAHMSEVLVRPGQRVQRGDLIGKVGSTGRSTGPHLHYEIFRDGRTVNPWTFIAQPAS